MFIIIVVVQPRLSIDLANMSIFVTVEQLGELEYHIVVMRNGNEIITKMLYTVLRKENIGGHDLLVSLFCFKDNLF